VIDFGGVEYLCITDLTINGSVDVASASCSSASGPATTHKAIGAENWTASGTFLAEDDAITLDDAFAPGTSGALIIYPFGNTSGKKSFSWTTAFVSTEADSGNTTTQGTTAVTLECDGPRTTGLVV
jgi:hypothetical protein